MTRIVPLAALATGLLSGALAQEAAALKLVKTIPLTGVKGRFDHFAVNAKGGRLFVAALGNNTLEVLDLAAGKRIKSITGLNKPTGVLYLAETNQIAVAKDSLMSSSKQIATTTKRSKEFPRAPAHAPASFRPR